jgi:hypothetical protein
VAGQRFLIVYNIENQTKEVNLKRSASLKWTSFFSPSTNYVTRIFYVRSPRFVLPEVVLNMPSYLLR